MMRKSTRGYIALGLSALLLGVIGYNYEKRAQAHFRARFSPPGRRVDVGGRRLHLVCMGQRRPNQPLVVFEAGHGAWSSCWQKVMPEIAKYARVCAYDRAGYGWSDPAPGQAEPDRMVADLRALLNNAGEPGPYLLVGHSMGAALGRLFATLYPADVAGMVWVDSVEEDLPAFLPVGRWTFAAAENAMKAGELLAAIGFLRWSGLGKFIAQYPSVSEAQDALMVEEQVSQPGYMRVLAAETRALANLDGWDRVNRQFGSLPVISLESLYADIPPHTPPLFWQQFRSGWHTMHDQLSMRSENLERIPAASGHVIMNERPELVIQAVRSMLDKIEAAQRG